MGDLTVGRRVVEMAAHMAQGQAEATYIDKAEIAGEEQRGDSQPQHDKGKTLPEQVDPVEHEIGKGVCQWPHQ